MHLRGDILRIESINRTPLISFYSESIQGIDTIKSLTYHKVDKIYFYEFSDKILQNFSVLLSNLEQELYLNFL